MDWIVQAFCTSATGMTLANSLDSLITSSEDNLSAQKRRAWGGVPNFEYKGSALASHHHQRGRRAEEGAEEERIKERARDQRGERGTPISTNLFSMFFWAARMSFATFL
jgi:hypothetical protein